MPTADGLLRLESDTSIYAAGGVLYQKQDDEWVLLGFHSKRMPPEVAKYGITELELAGLVCQCPWIQTFVVRKTV